MCKILEKVIPSVVSNECAFRWHADATPCRFSSFVQLRKSAWLWWRVEELGRTSNIRKCSTFYHDKVEIFGTCCMYKICIHIIYIYTYPHRQIWDESPKYISQINSLASESLNGLDPEWCYDSHYSPIFSSHPTRFCRWPNWYPCWAVQRTCTENPDPSWRLHLDLLPIHQNCRNWLLDHEVLGSLRTRLSWAMLRSKNNPHNTMKKNLSATRKKAVFRIGFFVKIHLHLLIPHIWHWYRS